MKSQKKSKAFTLIEILISLIIIGIVAVTIPIMLQTSLSSLKTSTKEEIFYQEFSLLNLINTLYFDENNSVDDNFYKDLNATLGDNELKIKKYSNELNRVGKHQMNNNILRSGSKYTVSYIGVDSGEVFGDDTTYDDIDDYNNFIEPVTGIKVEIKYILDEANYSDDKINFTFNYNSSANLTNIKLITISKKNIVINYPSMNIGASKYLSLEEISR